MSLEKPSGLFEYSIFIIALAIGIYLVFFKLLFLTIVIFVSYIIADAFRPLAVVLKKVGLPNWLASLIVVVGIVGVFGGIIFSVAPILVKQVITVESYVPDLIEGVTKYMTHISYYLSHLFGHKKEMMVIASGVVDYVRSHFTSFALSSVVSILRTLPAFGVLILIPIITYFFMVNLEEYRAKAKNLIQTVLGEDYLKVFEEIHDVIMEYIKGMVILIFLVIVSTFLGFALIGIDYAFLFSVLSGLLYIIPYIGATIAIVPPLVFAVLVHKSILLGLEVLAVFLPIHFVLGNIVAPFIFSRRLRMDPLAILLAMLLFGKLFGMLGVILSVPLLGIMVISYEKLIPILSKRRGD